MDSEKFFWQLLSVVISLWVITKLLGMVIMIIILLVCLVAAVGLTWWQLKKRKKRS